MYNLILMNLEVARDLLKKALEEKRVVPPWGKSMGLKEVWVPMDKHEAARLKSALWPMEGKVPAEHAHVLRTVSETLSFDGYSRDDLAITCVKQLESVIEALKALGEETSP